MALGRRPDVNVSLIVSTEHKSEETSLPENAPLGELAHQYFSMPEARAEKYRKLTGRPMFDRILPADTDWLYSPHDTRLPSRTFRTAITIHDARMFENNLGNGGMRENVANFVMRSWIRKAAKEADLVFTVSHFSKSRLCSILQLRDEKVVAVGNGLTRSFDTPENTDHNSSIALDRRNTVIVIGGLRRIKGGDRVIELARALSDRKSNIKILSIGGPDEPDLAAHADTLENIERLGFVSDKDLIKLMSDALTMLNCSRYEGFGLPTLEAMALGVPVIAQNETSLPEVVGDSGMLLNTSRTSLVVELIEKLRQDENVFRDYRARGLTRARSFSWEKVADRIFDAMQDYDSQMLRKSG